jgi:hypothetical protein
MPEYPAGGVAPGTFAGATDPRLLLFVDTFARPNGPIGNAPDGTAWTSAPGGVTPGPATIVAHEVANPIVGSGASTTYNTPAILPAVPDYFSGTFEIRAGAHTTDPAMGLLCNADSSNFLQNVVHCYATAHGLVIGRIVGDLLAGGSVVDDLLYSYPGALELPPGFYTWAVSRTGNTITMFDAFGVAHSFTHASYGAYWGKRVTFELTRADVATAREPRLWRAEAGLRNPTWRNGPDEVPHLVGTAGEPAYQGLFAAFGAPYNGARFWRVGNTIYLDGLIKTTGTVPNTAFVLPASHFPDSAEVLRFPNDRVDVAADGTITVQSAATTTLISLAGLSFRALNG